MTLLPFLSFQLCFSSGLLHRTIRSTSTATVTALPSTRRYCSNKKMISNNNSRAAEKQQQQQWNNSIELLFRQNIPTLQKTMEKFHPVLIEGPDRSDDRDATPIAQTIVQNLKKEIERRNITKPLLLIGQGDPAKTDNDPHSGVVKIIEIVMNDLGIQKGLVCIDEDIYDWHARDADRKNVIYEMRYSQMVQIIKNYDDNLRKRIEEEINNKIVELNKMRKKDGEEELKGWVKSFALLQEMTKIAMKLISGDVTIAHTIPRSKIGKYRVTGFYDIGLKIGLINTDDMIYYEEVSTVTSAEK